MDDESVGVSVVEATVVEATGDAVSGSIVDTLIKKKSKSQRRRVTVPNLEDKVWIIYVHTHVLSQKRYVGLTSKTMEHRWKGHLSDARKGDTKPFYCAIRKYGVDSFDHEVLEVVTTLDAANEAEQWWIAHFGSTDLVLGYNLSRGGTDFYSTVKALLLDKSPEGLERKRLYDEKNAEGWQKGPCDACVQFFQRRNQCSIKGSYA